MIKFLLTFLLTAIFQSKNYYQILGIGKTFQKNALRKAYKKKLIELHPDNYDDENQKKIAQQKYNEVQEAFEVLSDNQLKAAYDYGGMKRLEALKKERQEREAYKQQREANQEKYYGRKDEKIQDILESSSLPTMGPQQFSKFGRRITSWLVFFYKNDDNDLKLLTPVIEQLNKDFSGILEVVRVNCEQFDEFCRDFFVYGTPKLQIFPSFSGMEAKDFEFYNYMDLLESNKKKQFLSYLSSELIKTVEDFVIFLNSDNINKFSNSKNPKVVLVTNKNKTPLLWKVLSKEFRSYLDFGVIKQSSGSLISQLNVTKKPAILGFNKNIRQATEYQGEMNPHKIRQFLRTVINKENKESDFEILFQEELNTSSDCVNKDVKFCIFIFENSDFDRNKFQNLAKNLQNDFQTDPIKLLFVQKDFINDEFFKMNKFEFSKSQDILIYKSKGKKALQISVDFKQSEREIQNYIHQKILDLVSQILSLKKLSQEIDQYLSINDEL